MGQRDQYRPLVSSLCPGHDVLELCRTLLQLAPFPTIYIADLDAITGAGDNHELIQEIHQTFPGLQIWLDAGPGTVALACAGLIPVIGTESLHGSGDLRHGLTTLGRDGCILSLDFNDNRLLGPQALLRNRAHWPRRIIVMCLDRVGTDSGPDLDRLKEYRADAPGHILYAAGGVRDRQDLEVLSATGIHGVLVASALHDGHLDRQTLLAMMNHQPAGAQRKRKSQH